MTISRSRETSTESDAGSAPVDARMLRTRADVLGVALRPLIDEGWEAVNHRRVAAEAGYARTTIYTHWPTRVELVREALARLGEMPHHPATGDLRTDLVGELASFREGMRRHRLDRALAVLAGLVASVPDLVSVRDHLVSDGERVVRELLSPDLEGAELEATTLMLCGSVLHAALMHGGPPTDAMIESAVDLVMRGLPPAPA